MTTQEVEKKMDFETMIETARKQVREWRTREFNEELMSEIIMWLFKKR